MSNRNTKHKSLKLQAMWLIAHLRSVGAEPLPFNPRGYRAYVADLQRQYETIRDAMEKDAGRLARIAARALVREKTLKGISAGILPGASNVAAKQDYGKRYPLRVRAQIAIQNQVRQPLPASPEPPCPTLRDIATCRRKLRHLDYLSALLHLVRLGGSYMHAYPCPVCFGIHVGHLPGRKRLRQVPSDSTLLQGGEEL
jgi:hypothetical protein